MPGMQLVVTYDLQPHRRKVSAAAANTCQALSVMPTTAPQQGPERLNPTTLRWHFEKAPRQRPGSCMSG